MSKYDSAATTAPDLPSVAPNDRTKLATAIMWWGFATTAWATYKKAREWHDKRITFTVSVRSDDPMYQHVHDWLLTALPNETHKALIAVSSGTHVYESDGVKRPVAPLHLLFDDDSERPLTIDGHSVTVSVKRPETSNGRGQKDRMNYDRFEPDVIRFSGKSQAAQAAIVGHLNALNVTRGQEAPRPALHLLNTWGSWSRRNDLPLRSLDSVVLKEGQMDALVEDLERFLASEDEYVRRGMPWHRGYLLHGEPGTGKTSVVKALAQHFGMDLWFAPLGDLDKDAGLLALINEVKSRSILLLEDFDVFSAAKDRDAEDKEVSLSGLLNALDGVATPHGLITFMTTNDLSAIDPAVIRPGRVDRLEHVGLPDEDQTRRLFVSWYGEAPGGAIDPAGRSTADLLEVFRRNPDPLRAARELGVIHLAA